MPHPSLGFPPPDVTAGLPEAAAKLRASKERVARLSLQSAVALEPGLDERYDETALRLFLRDYDRHVEQLARALESGNDDFVVQYGEWLVPIYRRRRVPMLDFMALLAGMRDAAATVLTPAEQEASARLFERWGERLKHHGRLPGDHKGNAVVRFFWKGAGIGDDTWI